MVTKMVKSTRRQSVVITMFYDENRMMMKQKQAAMITPLMLSS